MSAIFYAAGPRSARGTTLDRVRSIDVAPTVLAILGVPPAPTVDGVVLRAALRAPRPCLARRSRRRAERMRKAGRAPFVAVRAAR